MTRRKVAKDGGKWEWSVHGEHPCICICTRCLFSWRKNFLQTPRNDQVQTRRFRCTSHNFHCVIMSVIDFWIKPLDSKSSNARPSTSQALGYLFCCLADTGSGRHWLQNSVVWPPAPHPYPLKRKASQSNAICTFRETKLQVKFLTWRNISLQFTW